MSREGPPASISNDEIEQIRNDKRRSGLYGKYRIERTDGRSAPGEKHEGCDYFVLDITHDPFAKAALEAYAAACKDDYPSLAADLRFIVLGAVTAKEVIADNERRKLPHA